MLLGISKYQTLIFLENLTFKHNGMSILFVSNYFLLRVHFDSNKILL